MNQEQKKTIERNLEMHGVEYQLLVCFEELSELTKAITKAERYPGDISRVGDVAEELADVSICIETIKMIYGISDENLKEEVGRKINRLERMMDDE